MFIDSRRSDVAWRDAVLGRGVGGGEIKEPVLKKDMLWGGIQADTRLVRGKVDEDLIVGQFGDGKQDLKFERRWGGRAGDSAINSKVVLEDVKVWRLEIELRGERGKLSKGQRDMGKETHPFVDLSVRFGLVSGSGIAHDQTEL